MGASQTTGTYLMPRMIGLFRQKYPDVSVQLQVHSTRRTGWSVANGQIDLAIIGGGLCIDMELNSLEAIKNAVQAGLGAAFVPVVSIERELSAGTIHRPQVADLQVRRQLKLITHPARYCSRASVAFRNDVLPVFASADSPIRQAAKVVPEAIGEQLVQN